MTDIATKLTRINSAKQDIKTAIAGKGRNMSEKTFEQYATEIDAIETSGAPSQPAQGLERWGMGAIGSLNYTSPTNEDNDNDWDMVALGNDHGLAIKAGKLYSWGNNTDGRTGLNVTTGTTRSPTQVGSATDWWMVSAGFGHSLGIRKTWNIDKYDYTLWVWGSRTNGRLGDGSTLGSQNTPVQIGTDTDWEWVSAAFDWSAAIKGGRLWTCGANTNGRTGQNTTTGNTTTWTNYDTESTGWTVVHCGYFHAVGVRDGELWAWGVGTNGITGFGDTTQRSTPTHTDNGTGWSHGNAGVAHSVMIKTNGTLWAFGLQTNGRLGNGLTTFANISTPTQIGSDTDWQQVKTTPSFANSGYHEFTYAIKGGKLYGTGINTAGQLGLPPSADVATFTEIGNGSNYVDLDVGSGFGMAIRRTT